MILHLSRLSKLKRQWQTRSESNPISFPKAVSALKASNGIVKSVSEQELAEAAREADTHGFFLCPHTAVAYAGIKQGLNDKIISKGDQVVVVSTAHGLKFTEFKNHCAANYPHRFLDAPFTPIDVEDDLQKVLVLHWDKEEVIRIA